jgi:hypothetical protein
MNAREAEQAFIAESRELEQRLRALLRDADMAPTPALAAVLTALAAQVAVHCQMDESVFASTARLAHRTALELEQADKTNLS